MGTKTFDQLTVITSTNDADKVVLWDQSADQAAAITVANILAGVLRVNGVNAMGAILDMGGFAITNVGNVDGVDVSALSSAYTSHAADATIHRSINDASSSSTVLWSGSKISTELADKLDEDGSIPLTANWDIGDGRHIAADKIRARDAAGLLLEDDGGNGIFIEDGGEVGIGTSTPDSKLHVHRASAGSVAAHSSAVIAAEHSTTASIQILTPDNTGCYWVQGSPTNPFYNFMFSLHSTTPSANYFAIGTTGSNRVQIYENKLIPSVDNTIGLGESGKRFVDVWAVNGTIQTSDMRQKQAVEESDLGLDFVMALEPKRWVWADQEITEERIVSDAANDDGVLPTITTTRTKTHKRPHYGLSAQQVKAAMDELGIADFAGYIHDPESDSYALRYNEFVGPMIAAIQELRAQIVKLEDAHGRAATG